MKTIQLTTEGCQYIDSDLLFEDIRYKFEAMMQEDYGIDMEGYDYHIIGDLGHSQGRGLALDGLCLEQEDIEKLLNIKFEDGVEASTHFSFNGNRRYQEKSIHIDYDYDFDEYDIAKDKKQDPLSDDEVQDLFESAIEDIERELLEIGDRETERLKADAIFFRGFEDWKKENNIEIYESYYDFEYSDTEKEGYTLVGEKGDTILELWVKLPKFKAHERITKVIEDGEEVSSKKETYYTL